MKEYELRKRCKVVCRGLVFLSVLMISGCLTVQKEELCRANPMPMPPWIYGAAEVDGFYVGIGQAQPNKDGFLAQKELARKKALAQLVESIGVTVTSELSQSITQKTNENGKTRVETLSKSELQVVSNLTLSEVEEAGSWIDPSTCIFSVRLKVKKEVADALVALKQAKALYQRVFDDPSATPAQKKRWLFKALAGVEHVDAALLPSKLASINELKYQIKETLSLLIERSEERRVWLLSANPEIRETLLASCQDFSESRGDTFLDTPCSTQHLCLRLAREYVANEVVWVKARGEMATHSLGLKQARLKVRASIFKTKTGVLVHTFSDSAQVMTFHAERVSWGALLASVLSRHMVKRSSARSACDAMYFK